FQCLLGLVEQPRVLDRYRCLIGKALLEVELLFGERREMVAMDDQDADRVAGAPQRCAGDRAAAGGARRLESRPIRYLGIDVIDVRQMDLPVLAIDHGRHIVAADLELRRRYRRYNPLRPFPDIDAVAPIAGPGNADT